jgi:RNA polymerase sigma-70 factor (ECF subfamily)
MHDEVFEAMWHEHYGSVARSAYLVVGDTEEAADIAQEAFARALQRWEAVRQLERPPAWVYKVAMNLALSRRRALRRRIRAFPERGEVAPPDEPRDDVAAALRALTPAQRAVVVLRYYLDWPVDQVASTLGKRPGTIRALSHQAMQRLRMLVTEGPDA